MTANDTWKRFQTYYQTFPELQMSLDISRMNFSETFFEEASPQMQQAFAEMQALEKGAIANPDENRMVGHYWLRAPKLAPNIAITEEILQAQKNVVKFAHAIHQGRILTEQGNLFKQVLIIGIGGSVLGPQFVYRALKHHSDPMQLHFIDNTDPDGTIQILTQLGAQLGQTLTIVISKTGSTVETKNGMLEARKMYAKKNLNFAKHAIAITAKGSQLEKLAIQEKWVQFFPMWDWVGGRTSETSAVGLVPAALQGVDIQAFLDGAQAMDEQTRISEVHRNPAALLALMWKHASEGSDPKDMVILPYKDRLELFSRYLQQLIMESIGKEKNLAGKTVHEGIVVYGNKGTTDQHAYVQQLREGPANFFATFIKVLKDQSGEPLEVEPGITAGDYLHGFLLGTRDALYENQRESITLTLERVTAQSVGALIALFERAVGYYAFMKGINAYHQPGVEAGKKAAGQVIALQLKLLKYLSENQSKPLTLEQLAQGLNAEKQVETLFYLLEHLASNQRIQCTLHPSPFEYQYQYIPLLKEE
ncbi:glucose-6-phosphate isomerase [Deltaproteobacteria bacterium TL4]